MLRDITLGQYFPGSSWIHRLDARTKIIITMVYIVSLFMVKSLLGYWIVILYLVLTIKISKVPFAFIAKGLKPIFIIILFTFVLNLFVHSGTTLWEWWIFKITKEGVINAVFMALRLILLIFGSSLLTFTTKPINLTDGIERLLSPFRRIGVPAHELAMIMTIALRFIPTLLEETDKIMKAQMARGADFESGNIIARGKALIPLLVPLFISAFRIAQDLAMAMEARCYRGGDGRTKMTPMEFQVRDGVATILMCFYMAIIIVQGFFLPTML